MYKNMLK